jgi:aminomuconate-semialdehyde/2-hydroxymuconate-6-semialdehyde dehydrogenase
VSLELGGKNAAIIFADCDFDKMIDGMMRALFLNSEQVCLCSKRVYVERLLFERFCTAIAERIKTMKVDWPHEAATQMGPLISSKHRDKVLSLFELARGEGSIFIAGGGVLSFGDARDSGAWVEPTSARSGGDDARCD